MKISELTKAYRLVEEMKIPVELLGQTMHIEVGQLAAGIAGGGVIRDCGAWQAGVRYLAGDTNTQTGLVETHDCWRWGCRWRNRMTHVSDESNAPGYGCAMWEYVSGPRDLTIEIGLSDLVLWPGESATVICRVMCGQEDITGMASAWGIARRSADSAADTTWDIDHNDFAGTLELTAADVVADKVELTVWADIRDPEQPAQIRRLSQRIL